MDLVRLFAFICSIRPFKFRTANNRIASLPKQSKGNLWLPCSFGSSKHVQLSTHKKLPFTYPYACLCSCIFYMHRKTRFNQHPCLISEHPHSGLLVSQKGLTAKRLNMNGFIFSCSQMAALPPTSSELLPVVRLPHRAPGDTITFMAFFWPRMKLNSLSCWLFLL